MPSSQTSSSRLTTTSARPRRVVLVAGAGRSGTSTFAGILQRLGVLVPQPEVVADTTNPRGFSESQWVVDLHDELLARTNVQVGDARPVAWSQTGRLTERDRLQARVVGWLEEQLALGDELVIKDPRLSWFLDLWRTSAVRAGAEPSYATMLRPPAEVVGSKRAHYNRRMDDAHGVAQWVNMMLGTEHRTRGSDRVFVRYHDLLGDWRTTVSRAGGALHLSGVAEPADDAVRRVEEFVDPGLRRIQLTWDDLELPSRLEEIARETWSVLDSFATPEDPGEAHDGEQEAQARLDELRIAYDAFYAESEAVARSSVIAAGTTARSRTERPDASAPVATAAPRAAGRPAGPVERLARRTPPRLRALVPARLRRWARRRSASRPGNA
ncbi:sulfotransferase family protein [Nocardioides mesophilus]|uniref:Sulfotransferase family protein n=1 Tax=Nocardioides mesophilus TaxID=433659 RepID=A0A7G9RAR0_9ACTN|nr:sulfotransferase family protein [Nocardioides mesophilus]QNN52685.1 sulfotransferase family protein [Nocardioides mesophilus]